MILCVVQYCALVAYRRRLVDILLMPSYGTRWSRRTSKRISSHSTVCTRKQGTTPMSFPNTSSRCRRAIVCVETLSWHKIEAHRPNNLDERQGDLGVPLLRLLR